jgi:hypothetical protein
MDKQGRSGLVCRAAASSNKPYHRTPESIAVLLGRLLGGAS